MKLEIKTEEEAGRWLGGHRRWQQAIISFFFFTPTQVLFTFSSAATAQFPASRLLLLNPSGNPPPATSPLLSSALIRNAVQLRVKGNEKATGLCDLNGRNKMLPATHRIELPICDWPSFRSTHSLYLCVCVYNVLSNEHTLHRERES